MMMARLLSEPACDCTLLAVPLCACVPNHGVCNTTTRACDCVDNFGGRSTKAPRRCIPAP